MRLHEVRARLGVSRDDSVDHPPVVHFNLLDAISPQGVGACCTLFAMPLLGLDIGSSSVKAAILQRNRIVGRLVRETFPTHYDGLHAEVDPEKLLRAVAA